MPARRKLSLADRTATLDAYDKLLAAACELIGYGFHPVGDIHEMAYAPARKLGLTMWPSLAQEIAADAAAMVPPPIIY